MSNVDIKTVQLPALFSQGQLGGLKEIVDQHLDDGCQVQFDANDVERIDGAAVQFLLVIGHSKALDATSVLSVKNINDIVRQAFVDIGIDNLSMFDSQALPTESSAA